MTEHPATPPARRRNLALAVGALGVVYGDIGTSPLYAVRECFVGVSGFPVDEANILGILSLVTWSLVLVAHCGAAHRVGLPGPPAAWRRRWLHGAACAL